MVYNNTLIQRNGFNFRVMTLEELKAIESYLQHAQDNMERVCIEDKWQNEDAFNNLMHIDREINEVREVIGEKLKG